MMENGFSSPRSDAFPAGLRVLVVDDDPTWLKILEKMLKKCSYEVTTCCLARDALSLLRERKDRYDIVISDVNMPDMDGFKLLEHVGLEMDLPVIMMSVDGETSRVMKGVQHGACDYLLKPIRMKELRNIWQHVLRKKIHEVRDIESHEGIEVLQLMRHGSDQTEDSLFFSGEDFILGKKRKDSDSKHDDFGDSSSSKKPRVVWTIELHQKFVEAVNEIGFEKVGPKRILDSMKVPWLTRENVASHLQKYRLYLSRLQKENDLKVSFKHPDLLFKDNNGKVSASSSANPHQNEAASVNYVFSSNKLLVQQSAGAKSLECDSEGVVASMPVIESKRTLITDVHVPHEPDIRYSWGEVPEIKFKQEHEPLLQVNDSFIHPPLSDQIPLPHQPAASLTSRPSSRAEHEHVYDEFRNNDVTSLPTTLGMKNEMPNVDSITGFGDSQTNPILGNASPALRSFNEDLEFIWPQSDHCAKSLSLPNTNMEFSEENDPVLFGEVPLHLYDALRFDYEYPCDPIIF